MQKFLAALVLTSVLVLPFPALDAQRKTPKATKAAPVSVASQRGADEITAAQLKNYLYFIASDEMEGRDTPSRGLDTTAKFLAMNLSRWGLKPAGDDGSYFQKIALSRDVIDKAETRVQINNQPLTLGDDYIPSVRSADVAAAPMLFAGNGWFVRSKSMDA